MIFQVLSDNAYPVTLSFPFLPVPSLTGREMNRRGLTVTFGKWSSQTTQTRVSFPLIQKKKMMVI